jgi:peroxiredoxin
MGRTILALLSAAALAASAAAAEKPAPIAPAEKTLLFNGKDLTGWVPFVAGKGDPKSVWSVSGRTLRCTGAPRGYLRTEKAYTNYRLHLEWRWVGKPGNSGVLLHVTGSDKVWPTSIECQLAAGSAGDLWLIGGTGVTVDGKAHTKGRVAKKAKSSERKGGEWNTAEIVCEGDTIRIHVNGVLQAHATKASQAAGHIALQSEGAPIEFRNVYFVSPAGERKWELDFTLEDQDGGTVKLSDHRGKIIVLEWINWDCPFSRRPYEKGTFPALAAKYADKGVVWLAINSTHYATQEKDKAWIAKHKLAYPILHDAEGTVGRQYAARTTPHMYVIDRSGKIAYQGALDDDPRGQKAQPVNYVERALAELLADKPVSTPKTTPYGCSVKYKPEK